MPMKHRVKSSPSKLCNSSSGAQKKPMKHRVKSSPSKLCNSSSGAQKKDSNHEVRQHRFNRWYSCKHWAGIVSNQKFRGGQCLSFAFADMTTVMYRMIKVISMEEYMSGQCPVDCQLPHYAEDFMRFAKQIGFQTTTKYPYEGVPRSDIPDWSNWLEDGEIRFTIDDFECYESEKAIRDAIIENIWGPRYPCVAIVKTHLLPDSPPDEDEEHAVLVIGADMTNSDPEKHFIAIKNSWGKSWMNGGFVEIHFNILTLLCVPKFNRVTNALRYYTRTLSFVYKKITDMLRSESATILATSSPNAHMSILVEEVMVDQVPKILEKLLVKPSLVDPPRMAEGGLLPYLEMLAVGYEKTQELVEDLLSMDYGDVDIKGLAKSLFMDHKDTYLEYEQASLEQLYNAKMQELLSESQLSDTVVSEFVHWNQEALFRCRLFLNESATFEASVKTIWTCLLEPASQYTIKGLERARDSFTKAEAEAATLREGSVLGTKATQKAKAAAAAAAGESSLKSLMGAAQHGGNSVAIVEHYFGDSISWLLQDVVTSREEMVTVMSSAKDAACKIRQQCIETVMAEVKQLLSTEQKENDYKSQKCSLTNACIRVGTYFNRVSDSAFTTLEGDIKQAFLTELGNCLHEGLCNHWQKNCTVNERGGPRFKLDITAYRKLVRGFGDLIDKKFESLETMATKLFPTAAESLSSQLEGMESDILKDAQRFIQLRDDYKSAGLADKLSSFWPSS